jgi:hypothetical protein
MASKEHKTALRSIRLDGNRGEVQVIEFTPKPLCLDCINWEREVSEHRIVEHEKFRGAKDFVVVAKCLHHGIRVSGWCVCNNWADTTEG